MATRMQQRRGTAQQWTDANPRLAAGEIGLETDTNKFKIGDDVNFWDDLAYFINSDGLAGELDGYATEGYVDGAISNILGGAPELLDTLNELAAAIGDDENFLTTISASIATKQDKVTNVSDTEIGYLDGVTSAIQTQINSKAATSHTHAQADITNLTTDLAAKAPLANPTFTGTVAGVTKTHVGLANVDNTSDVDKPISTATQTALSEKADTNSPTFTGLTDFEGIVDFSEATVIGIETGPVQSSTPHPFSMIG
jgi:hypothetical protein